MIIQTPPPLSSQTIRAEDSNPNISFESDPAIFSEQSRSQSQIEVGVGVGVGEESFDGGDENIFRDMTFEEVLEDLNARFLVNLPREEMSLVRVYWQAEQAHWFYEDYLRPLNPLLPSLSQKHFTHLIIASSPLYTGLTSEGDGIDYDAVWDEYCSYKRMVPVCGGILVNSAGDKALMVRGWKTNAGWCFPRGKINSEESEEACAVREVEEETGFDLTGRIISKDRIQTQINAQTVTMFIIGGIDENTVFQTQTRNEIGAIEWVNMTELPTWTGKRGPKTTSRKGQKKFYNVTPFVGPLKRWLSEHGYKIPTKAQAQAHTQSKKVDQTAGKLRDLQPYQFENDHGFGNDVPLEPYIRSAPLSAHPTTALDNLFTKFVNVQQESLETNKPVGKESTKDGLERLFGNLLSTSKHNQAPIDQKSQLKSSEPEESRIKEEDDALAMLLGAISTPVPSVPQVKPPTEGKAKLLAVLNQRDISGPSTTTNDAKSNPSQRPSMNSTSQSQPQTPQTPPRQVSPPIKPHQASLLAMLSPQSRPAEPSASNAQRSTPHQSPFFAPPVVSASTGSPASSNTNDDERKKKQQALLELTMAGLSIAPSSPSKTSSNIVETVLPAVTTSVSPSRQHQSTHVSRTSTSSNSLKHGNPSPTKIPPSNKHESPLPIPYLTQTQILPPVNHAHRYGQGGGNASRLITEGMTGSHIPAINNNSAVRGNQFTTQSRPNHLATAIPVQLPMAYPSNIPSNGQIPTQYNQYPSQPGQNPHQHQHQHPGSIPGPPQQYHSQLLQPQQQYLPPNPMSQHQLPQIPGNLPHSSLPPHPHPHPPPHQSMYANLPPPQYQNQQPQPQSHHQPQVQLQSQPLSNQPFPINVPQPPPSFAQHTLPQRPPPPPPHAFPNPNGILNHTQVPHIPHQNSNPNQIHNSHVPVPVQTIQQSNQTTNHPLHQPAPRGGPQAGLLAMLNDGRR